MQTCIDSEEYTFCVIKFIGAPKKLNTGRNLYLDLDLFRPQKPKQIHIVRLSLEVTKYFVL